MRVVAGRDRANVVDAAVLWDFPSHEIALDDGSVAVALVDQCEALLDAGRHHEALAAARAALAANPELVAAHRIVAVAYVKLNDRAQAVAAWLAYTGARPYDDIALREAARELHALGRSSLAADLLTWSSAHHAEDASATHDRVLALVECGRSLEAERAATSWLTGGRDSKMHMLRARARLELASGAAGALADLAIYLEDRPFDLGARALLADAFEEFGRADQAFAVRAAMLQQIEHECAAAPTDAALLVARARARMAIGRHDGAASDAFAATARAPHDAVAWHVLGQARLAAGSERRALAALQRGHDLAPDRIDIAYDHCRALVACARADLAAPSLARVLAASARFARRAAVDPLLRGLA